MESGLIDFLEIMISIRSFEEQAIEMYKEGLVGGSYHSYIGQEAVATGVCAALRRDDYITTTYRGRGQHLAKGADPRKLYEEILGKVDGYCQGKGGPMHIACPDIGVLGANGIVGAGVPISVGAALSASMSGTDRVSVAFFGEGAINQGVVYEACNLAAIWSLPLILVCENNEYSEMTPIRDAVKNLDLGARTRALGIESLIVDGNDVEAVYRNAKDAVARARAGEGPTFVEAQTYRMHGHMYGDPETYRTKEEVERWRAKDPILRAKERTLAFGLATPDQLKAMETRVAANVTLAAQAARTGKEPDPALIFADVV